MPAVLRELTQRVQVDPAQRERPQPVPAEHVFPQIAGLGYSPTSRTYAITSLAEARAYLAHPVLGARLTECAGVLAGLRGRTAEQIFGEIDALKLCSSMTLFMRADPGEPVFRQVLDQYFGGLSDAATEQRI